MFTKYRWGKNQQNKGGGIPSLLPACSNETQITQTLKEQEKLQNPYKQQAKIQINNQTVTNNNNSRITKNLSVLLSFSEFVPESEYLCVTFSRTSSNAHWCLVKLFQPWSRWKIDSFMVLNRYKSVGKMDIHGAVLTLCMVA